APALEAIFEIMTPEVSRIRNTVPLGHRAGQIRAADSDQAVRLVELAHPEIVEEHESAGRAINRRGREEIVVVGAESREASEGVAFGGKRLTELAECRGRRKRIEGEPGFFKRFPGSVRQIVGLKMP